MTSLVYDIKSGLKEFVGEFVDDFVHPNVRKYVSKNQLYILSIVVIAIIFVFLSVYLYNITIKPLIDKNFVANSEFVSKENGDVMLYYFYTNWCPYCKKALPEWIAFKDYVNNTTKYDASYNIIFLEIDCEEDARTASRFNIESYPSILMFYNGETYIYDAKPDQGNLVQFLDSSLQVSTEKKWFGIF